MNESFLQNPLVLLFFICAIGYAIGKINFFGGKLGVSAILFVGLLFGAMNPNAKIPIIIFELGLVLFVYSIGISTGGAFFKSIKTNGLRDIGFVLTALSISIVIAVFTFHLLGLSSSLITGIYAGTSTNTPALAGVMQMVRENDPANFTTISELLTVGYTFSYPLGILGVLFVFKLMKWVLKIDFAKEFNQLKKIHPLEDELSSKSIRITNPQIIGKTIRDIHNKSGFNILFGRISRKNGARQLPHWDLVVEEGDDLMVIGSPTTLNEVVQLFGEESKDNISYDRKFYDVRTIFVSNPDLFGRELSSLNLNQKYDAIITRIRRGDIDMLAKPDITIEAGDRIRFVAKREDLNTLSKLFGDSYNAVSQVNIFSFGIGITLGLLIGAIEFHLSDTVRFKLGIAGGPLIVGLILGTIRRTGSISWIPPYGVNTTMNQFGLILLLAVIGLNSGGAFVSNIDNGIWKLALLGGTIVSILSAITSILIGYKLFKIPFSLLLGFLSNQPAILEFSKDMTGNRTPLIAYSIMFPIALIIKVLFAQLLYLFLTN